MCADTGSRDTESRSEETKPCRFPHVLVFAGTSEGHALAKWAVQRRAEAHIDFSVATEYGEEVLKDLKGINILEGRMGLEEMEELILKKSYDLIIDATHPYARDVTENIKEAAENTGVKRLRLVREEKETLPDNVVVKASAEEAAVFLNKSDEGVLLATGSKDLNVFSEVRGFKDRFVARVLPSEKSIRACLEAGLPSKRIICMQGPFSLEMNLATLRQYGLVTLVTKSSGKAGGFDEKIACADYGFRVIVIGRPAEETGLSLDEVIKVLDDLYRRKL
jgi:precorrin-6A/cobalt-precorrin-6A reductase